jgi:hypothetical protein
MLSPRGAVLGFSSLVVGTLGALAISVATLLLTSAPADAHVAKVSEGSETIAVGMQPREMARYWEGGQKWSGLGSDESESNAPAQRFNDDPNRPGHPGPVMHAAGTYVIYWDPQDYYHGDWQALIDGFMANAGSANGALSSVFAVDTQYTDTTNEPATSRSVFHGAYTDTNPYPENENCTDPHEWKFGVPLLESSEPACLTDKQIRAQLKKFIGEQHDIQKGMGTIFYVLTPPGVTVCLGAGGPSGSCSDFDGTAEEISEYEEEKNKYQELLIKYHEELEKYEKEEKKYLKEKEEKEKNHEPPPSPPTKPTAPVETTIPEPAGYTDYTKSFCSYHSDINSAGNPEGGSPETVLYAVIPWIAGGAGDYHLSKTERTGGYDCQDGGFESGGKPLGELQEKERTKLRSLKEQEEFDELPAKEKREEEEARELGLEKPHEQEPNQLGEERGPDAFWDHGLADLIINQIAVEQQNTVTDPLLNGWQDPSGNELTDECRNSFFSAGGSAGAHSLTRAGTLANQSLGAGKYYLNDAFNLASQGLPYPGVPCTHGVTLEPKFTAPNPVNSGEVVGFDGMESDITLDSAIGFTTGGAMKENYATYTWNFGDGSPEVSGYAPGAPSLNSPSNSPCAEPWLSPCAASTFHTYQYGGTYNVTLTVKDVGGNEARFTEAITVDGPAAPSPTPAPQPAPSPGAFSPSTTGAGSSSTTGATTKPPVPGPVASTAVASSSLSKTTRKGLVVRYSVNEQVTGRFNVLLAASIAQRIGLRLPLATGLPTGTAPQVVVGKALLITTKGGRGTLKIQFGKVTGARLRRLGRVSLMLQLNLRNALGGATTVLSKITLR